MKLKVLVGILAVAGCIVPGAASATNGYFSHGYGIKAKSMGGVGIALPQDALAAATNPAGMVLIGDRIDFGLDWFSPDRTATWTASNGVFDRPLGDYNSGSKNFFIPEFGYNKMINDRMSLGVAVYGNGGMNTDYGKVVISGSTSNTYSNLEQLFIAPTWAMKLSPEHAIGVTLNLAYQTFEARGLEAFATGAQSTDSGNVTNRGKDSSTGYGLKVGWIGQLSPTATMGATYQTKTKMQKFGKYRGLFAEQGGFDVPETYGAGIAIKANPKTTIAADVVQINYGSIRSLANQGTQFPSVSGNLLGGDNGAGFGWEDQTVFKFAVAYEYSPNLTLRAGYNYAKMPLTEKNTFFNVLAPATVEQHLTLGGTWTLANKSELTVSYMHAFSKGINGISTGSGSHPAGTFGAVEGFPVNLKMDQNALGIAYGWKM